jgi:hypothetical protein
MARPRNGRGQSDTIRRIVVFSGIIGVLILIGAVASGVRLSPEWQVKSNPSDQLGEPGGQPQQDAAGGRRETTGDNSGTGGNAGRLGSGAPGSGTGSPTGSSGNVTGSAPQGGGRSGVPGSSTR